MCTRWTKKYLPSNISLIRAHTIHTDAYVLMQCTDWGFILQTPNKGRKAKLKTTANFELRGLTTKGWRKGGYCPDTALIQTEVRGGGGPRLNESRIDFSSYSNYFGYPRPCMRDCEVKSE